MEKVLSFQMIMFGSYENIKPDGDIAMRLLENFQDFVPGTAIVPTIDMESRRIVNESRLQMVSADKMWTIIFLQNLIDINYEYTGGADYYTDLDVVFSYAQRLLEKTFRVFSDTAGNRLAVNGEFLLKEMSADKRNAFLRRYSVPCKIYGDSEIKEWKVHFNAPVKLFAGEGVPEDCNNIIEIGDIFGVNTQGRTTVGRIAVKIDINTDPENTDTRFNYKNLMSFSESAKPMMKEALEEIEDF